MRVHMSVARSMGLSGSTCARASQVDATANADAAGRERTRLAEYGGVGPRRQPAAEGCKLKKRKARAGALAFLEGLSNLLGGLPEMRRLLARTGRAAVRI